MTAGPEVKRCPSQMGEADSRHTREPGMQGSGALG